MEDSLSACRGAGKGPWAKKGSATKKGRGKDVTLKCNAGARQTMLPNGVAEPAEQTTAKLCGTNVADIGVKNKARAGDQTPISSWADPYE